MCWDGQWLSQRSQPGRDALPYPVLAVDDAQRAHAIFSFAFLIKC